MQAINKKNPGEKIHRDPKPFIMLQ